MDAESFSSLDLNDFSAVKDHFTKLLAIIYPGEPFDWKLFIDNLTEDKPEECHAILREGAEEVHRTLFDGELQNPSILAGAVLSSILHVIHSAIELDVGVQSLVHGIETKNTYPEGMASKDCTPKGGEYEVVE
ncbi:hypothetical protein C0992_005004 [Termitomyces sp. T32_za158]|nr:hypothetical protein C0992_005004 [Termitomyces sp. T32_za158]